MKAFITPKVLEWARKSANISDDEAAHKAGVDTDTLLSWEKGEELPSITHIRKLGAAYKRPIAVFYLPEPPTDFQPLKDYRRMPGKIYRGLSAELNFEIRSAHDRRSLLIDLYEDMGEEPPKFSGRASMDDDPEKLAQKIRGMIGVSLQKQAIRDPNACFNYWRSALDELGIIVFQIADVAETEARGFSISEAVLPVIAANRKDNPRSRVFTMMHELVHLMLKGGGLCDLDDKDGRRPEEQKVEVFCNHVAGAILVPENDLLNKPVVIAKGKDKIWADQEIEALAKVYGINREVILRRLLIFSRTTKEFYEQKRGQYQKEYATRPKKTKPGFLPPALDAVSSLGRPYVHIVLDAFHQEKITAGGVSDYLGVQVKHLSRIEELVSS